MLIDIARLHPRFNPMRHGVWAGERITRQDVKRAMKAPLATPIGARPACKAHHAARIAWFVLNGWKDAIVIDVGVPGMPGYIPCWPIADGNHRLSAAIYRRDLNIEAEVGGSVRYAKELFGIDI